MIPVASRLGLFGREEELLQFCERLHKGVPFLLYGVAGVGKTLLVETAIRRLNASSNLIYCEETRALNAVARQICSALAARDDACVLARLKLSPKSSSERIQSAVQAKSSSALQGIVLEALRKRPYTLILDHVEFVSKRFYSSLKELHLFAQTPIVAIARSYHMEEIGHLGSLFSDRRARMELANFDRERAAGLAAMVAESRRLEAENREEFLRKVVQFSQGNPGAILRMIAMADDPHYRSSGRIRLHLLYVDYCLRYSGVRK